MRFLTFVGKNLLRRPARSALTMVGISVAVAAAVSLVGVSDGFERSYLDLYRSTGVDLVVQRAGQTQQLTSGLDESLGDRMAQLDGVHQVIGGLVDVVAFEQFDMYMVIINGWKVDCPTFDRLTWIAGRRLRPDEREAVVLGKVLAANLGKRIGDSVELYGRPFRVVGIFESFHVYENGAAVMLLSELQRMTGRPREVTGYTIEVQQPIAPQGLNDVKQRIEALEPGLAVLKTADFVGSITQIRLAHGMAWLTSTIALILGAIGVLNTMVMSVYERARELGVLRALGWRRRRVVRMVFSESLLLSLGGAVLGSIAGLTITHVLGRLPATSGLIQGSVAPGVIGLGFAIALVMGLLGASYPAYWTANLRPVEALRRR